MTARSETESLEAVIAMAACEAARCTGCVCKRDGRIPAKMITAVACINALGIARAAIAAIEASGTHVLIRIEPTEQELRA